MVQSSSDTSLNSTIKPQVAVNNNTTTTMTTIESDFKIFKGKKFNYKDKDVVIDRSSSPSLDYTSSREDTPGKVESLRLAGYFNENEALIDPIFNLMDNYSALLCCAFLHVNLIQSLYFLGKHISLLMAMMMVMMLMMTMMVMFMLLMIMMRMMMMMMMLFYIDVLQSMS